MKKVGSKASIKSIDDIVDGGVVYGRPVPPHTSGGGWFPTTTGTMFPTSSTYSVMYCPMCGSTYSASSIHACASTSSPYVDTSKVTKVSAPVKHINWQQYTPANPPKEGDDYIIVYHKMTDGKKESCRGSFTINDNYQYQWKDEDGKVIFATVTHYAKLDLP